MGKYSAEFKAIERKRELDKDAENLMKVSAACTVSEDNQLVRGFVTSLRCRGCNMNRWNDGTKCSNLRADGKVCGHRVVEDLNRLESGREG